MGFSFDSLLLTATLSLLLFLSLFFYCFFLPPTPNPLPSGKRALRFASPGFKLHHFYLPLIDVVLFKEEELRWGSPTATTPFEPFGLAPKDECNRRSRIRL
jgi:hypothetical protein